MTMLFSACADWVNVSPKDEIEADKLFKSENGFKVALIGVYSRMTWSTKEKMLCLRTAIGI